MIALDPRRGVPSASGLYRLSHCPASFDMEKASPPEEESEDAASGTRIHAVLAVAPGADINALTASEVETLDMCIDQEARLIEAWDVPSRNDYGAVDVRIDRELRLGLTAFGNVVEADQTAADFVFTGQADLILSKDGKALVIDYKTGRGKTPVAADNPQLAGLAVLVSKWLKVENVRVAIIQPWAGKPTVADYGANGLKLAESWLHEVLYSASKAMPQDVASGDWCKFCLAQAGCEAFKNTQLTKVEALNPMTIAGADDETQRKALFVRAMELPAEKLAASMRGLAMVKKFVAAIEGAARARAEDDTDFQRFYRLKEKKGRRSISDVGKVFTACHERGVTAENFTELCSIGLGDVKELLRKATGLKGKSLDAAHDAVLTGAVDTGKASFELVAVGELEGGES